MSHKVIVTGAAGFIGSHLCDALLHKGCHVVGIDSFDDNYDVRIKRRNISGALDHGRFRLVEGSLNDIDLAKLIGGAEYLFHSAARAGVRDSWRENFNTYVDENIRATQRLCEAASGLPLRRFVVASSSSVYGETTELPMNEAHPTRPLSPYGVTKLASEALCLLYRKNYGLPVVALRYFTVFGPRQRPDMAFHRFIRSAMNGRAIDVFGNGTQTRDFTYVSDIVDANLSAMDYDGEGSVFNIGGGNRITVNAALDILGDVMGQNLDVAYQERVKGDVTHTYADISFAGAELGYAPTVGIEAGLANEVAWMQTILQRNDDR